MNFIPLTPVDIEIKFGCLTKIELIETYYRKFPYHIRKCDLKRKTRGEILRLIADYYDVDHANYTFHENKIPSHDHFHMLQKNIFEGFKNGTLI